MKERQLIKLGLPNRTLHLAKKLANKAASLGIRNRQVYNAFKSILNNPSQHTNHPHFSPLANALLSTANDKTKNENYKKTANNNSTAAPPEPAPWKSWCPISTLEKDAIRQMTTACHLPIAIRGALMPDAHVGYGLPIGGVLATDNAIIPYAVGVDIGCRVKLSILDIPADDVFGVADAGPLSSSSSPSLSSSFERRHLADTLQNKTRFGIGATFSKPHYHPILDYDDWNDISPLTRRLKDKARSQLGTSGSGNHFVEWGIVTTHQRYDNTTPPGRYLALLSHSGSRGPGAAIASHYARLAQKLHPDLDGPSRHLAWLDASSDEGMEYFRAMTLMGEYARANHEVIHKSLAKALPGCRVLRSIESHHNYCWKEHHDGREVYVHRKGATPAARGEMGVVPGSMTSPTYIVRGLGCEESLNSAAHGAGRVMSRRKANRTFRWEEVGRELRERDVMVLSAGLDESPGVYKDIREVMERQRDLVEVMGEFEPKIVKMAPKGEPPED